MDFIENLRYPLTLAAAVSCGVIAGILFAFSNFIMAALERISPSAGMAAMQSINVTVLNPVFFLFFLGAAVLSVVLGIYGVAHWQQSGSVWLVAGAVLYVLGSFVVTAAANVSLNEALAKLDAANAASFTFWTEYIAKWCVWNHVRTIASLLACVAFIAGLPRQG